MNFAFPYPSAPDFSKPVAYFCMEYAIHQAFKVYAGGLGYLAGSHMRSAYALQQNIIGIGILWKYGYYDQVRKGDQSMDMLFQEKLYGFLVKTDIKFTIRVSRHDVTVVAWYLPPSVFKTAPLFFLSTDTEENDYLAKTICHRLYDTNPETQIAASILLGAGGMKLLEVINWQPEIYHLNESHGVPLAFRLYAKYRSLNKVRELLVFTNHTPEPGGNPQNDINLLERMDFFEGLDTDTVRKISELEGNSLNYTAVMLRLAGTANAVSKKHQQSLQTGWAGLAGKCEIIAITNAQNFEFWAHSEMYNALDAGDDERLRARKNACKQLLFDEVADQNGEFYDPAVLTMVFAKRFAAYKRPALLLQDPDRFHRIVTNKDFPVQLIWAGKPHPMDFNAIATFDRIVNQCKSYGNCSILVGYELKLSRLLKQGADIWLNLPRISREASGTSGMSAAMNGAINLSMPDGWYPEFVKEGVNGFVIPSANPMPDDYSQDEEDANALYSLLENVVIPMYYNDPRQWISILKNSMRDIAPQFGSDRLAIEYYRRLYCRERIPSTT